MPEYNTSLKLWSALILLTIAILIGTVQIWLASGLACCAAILAWSASKQHPYEGGRRLTAAHLWSFVLVASCFGPYISQGWGVRTEQLVFYGSMIALAPSLLTHFKLRPWGGLLVGSWLAILAMGVVAGLFSSWELVAGPGLLSSFEAMTMGPVAVAVAAGLIGKGYEIRHLIGGAITALIGLLSANATLAYYSTANDITALAGRFWTSSFGLEGSVAIRAESNGRFSGIFNQPAEAGGAYSIGIIALVYAWFTWPRHRVLVGGAAPFILVGGFLSVSKIFILVGIPLAVLQIVLNRRKRIRNVAVATVTFWLVLNLLGSSGNRWTGEEKVASLLTGGRTASSYTAGRYGEGGTLVTPVQRVLDHDWLFGLGMGRAPGPFDSAWIEIFSMAGVVGLLLFGVVLASLCACWWHARRSFSLPMRNFSGGLIIIAAIGGLGLPIMSANRVAALLWFFLGLTLLVSSKREAVLASSESEQQPGLKAPQSSR